jgi:hypothetical protein
MQQFIGCGALSQAFIHDASHHEYILFVPDQKPAPDGRKRLAVGAGRHPPLAGRTRRSPKISAS